MIEILLNVKCYFCNEEISLKRHANGQVYSNHICKSEVAMKVQHPEFDTETYRLQSENAILRNETKQLRARLAQIRGTAELDPEILELEKS